jgi:hypothetical protein
MSSWKQAWAERAPLAPAARASQPKRKSKPKSKSKSKPKSKSKSRNAALYRAAVRRSRSSRNATRPSPSLSARVAFLNNMLRRRGNDGRMWVVHETMRRVPGRLRRVPVYRWVVDHTA